MSANDEQDILAYSLRDCGCQGKFKWIAEEEKNKKKKKGLPPDECTSFEVETGEPDNNKTRRNGKKKWEKE